MDTSRVLYFLKLLSEETSGCNDILAQLYQQALDENDDAIKLKQLLENHQFYGELGAALQKNGDDLHKSFYLAPQDSLDTLPKIRQVCERIENEAKISEELLCSPFPFDRRISVVRKSQVAGSLAALSAIAKTCVYLIALYAGIKPLKSLSWDESVGFQERVNSINTRFLPALCSVQRPGYSWIITKKRTGGRALFEGAAFALRYESPDRAKVLCGGCSKEPIGTHAFLNVDAYESSESDVPFCWGIGNLLSQPVSDSLRLMEENVASRLRAPHRDELAKKMPKPDECLTQLADGAVFCVSPDELALRMNQWLIGHEIEERRKTHRCLLCGNPVGSGRQVCRMHFR